MARGRRPCRLNTTLLFFNTPTPPSDIMYPARTQVQCDQTGKKELSAHLGSRPEACQAAALKRSLKLVTKLAPNPAQNHSQQLALESVPKAVPKFPPEPAPEPAPSLAAAEPAP